MRIRFAKGPHLVEAGHSQIQEFAGDLQLREPGTVKLDESARRHREQHP